MSELNCASCGTDVVRFTDESRDLCDVCWSIFDDGWKEALDVVKEELEAMKRLLAKLEFDVKMARDGDTK